MDRFREVARASPFDTISPDLEFSLSIEILTHTDDVLAVGDLSENVAVAIG